MKHTESLYYYETEILDYYKKYTSGENAQGFVSDKEALEKLTASYGELLEQSRFITKVSDRLERKLEMANGDLVVKNAELKRVLDELMKARASKKARAILYSIAIGLFVLEEFFVEPFIDIFNEGPWTGLFIKLLIVLLLKPAEFLLESRLLQSKLQPTVFFKEFFAPQRTFTTVSVPETSEP